MSFDIRHTRHVNHQDTTYGSLTAAKAALARSSDALMQDLYAENHDGSLHEAGQANQLLDGFIRLTQDHRWFLYLDISGTITEFEFVSGYA